VGSLLCFLGYGYLIVLFVRIVLSWFPIERGTAMDTVHRTLRSLTDPVLEPVRRLIPPIGMFDISPIIVLIGIQVLLGFIC
jgi:YggT family protein